jgi:hypothetical protein
MILTVYHFRGHDSLSLAVFNGIVLWGAANQTGTTYRILLAFESDIRAVGVCNSFSGVRSISGGVLSRLFPFSLTVSLAAYFIIRKDDLNFLWR